jgi:hypothetical protein
LALVTVLPELAGGKPIDAGGLCPCPALLDGFATSVQDGPVGVFLFRRGLPTTTVRDWRPG